MTTIRRFLTILFLAFLPLAGLTQTNLPPVTENYFALPFSSYANAVSLAASTAETITAPAWGTRVLFSSNCANFFVKTGGTATVPGDTTDGTSSVANPTQRLINGGEAISIISAAACVVVAEFFAR